MTVSGITGNLRCRHGARAGSEPYVYVDCWYVSALRLTRRHESDILSKLRMRSCMGAVGGSVLGAARAMSVRVIL